MGLWVMKAETLEGRMTNFVGLVERTNLSQSDRRSLSLKLPLRKGGLPYVAFCAPQDAGLEGSFTITVTSVDDPGLRLVALDESVIGTSTACGSVTTTCAAAVATLHPSGSEVAMRHANFLCTEQPTNQPVVETIGQGLSKKHQQVAAQAIEMALAVALASGGKYEDPTFAPSDESLGAPAKSLGVTTWRRPEEIEENFTLDLEGAEKIGLHLGSLKNDWLLGALNVVGSNVDVSCRLFVDASHAAHGFYAVRLYAEDPISEDNWSVVLVDDRLPCGEDGRPAFSRGDRAGALWASIVEKAVAKRYGSYSKLAPATTGNMSDGGEATLRGLELVTGGKARELEMPPPEASEADRDALWQQLKECGTSNQVVCARCESESAASVSASKMGITLDRTYCVLVAGDTRHGRLVKMRGFAGESEWSGRWSDSDSAWTNAIRQELDYRKDGKDGTFLMSFDDFAEHFSAAFATRVGDDRWTRLSVKSRWMDASAGGAPASVSFRNNYQWRLELPRSMELTLQLSLPDPRLGDGTTTTTPMGLLVVRSNPPPNARRRKLRVIDRSEIVYEMAPHIGRRRQASVRLDATPLGGSYMIIPYLATPGAESWFNLTVLVDLLDDDGKPDLTFEPCLPSPPNKEDWHIKRVECVHIGAKGAPGRQGFDQTRVRFTLGAAQEVGEGRVLVCLEMLNALTSLRFPTAARTTNDYPAIGMALLPSDSGTPSERLPPNAIEAGPAATDGLWLEATLPMGSTPHSLVPFYASPGQPQSTLKYAITIYSDVPIGDVRDGAIVPATDVGGWPCEACSIAEGGHGPTCPFRTVVEKMQRMESLLDERIAFLNEVLCQPTSGGFGQ